MTVTKLVIIVGQASYSPPYVVVAATKGWAFKATVTPTVFVTLEASEGLNCWR